MARRSHLISGASLQGLWRCRPPTKRISEKELLRNTNSLFARVLADRLSRAFAVVNSRLTGVHKHSIDG